MPPRWTRRHERIARPLAVEPTETGEQTLVPGVVPIMPGDRLAWRAAAPMQPKSRNAPAITACSTWPLGVSFPCLTSFRRRTPAAADARRVSPHRKPVPPLGRKTGPALTRSQTMKLDFIAHDKLSVSKANMRYAKKARRVRHPADRAQARHHPAADRAAQLRDRQ
ncbi:hypothetical protein [Hankyongella ginsenosidimutans]|uniref:hypothetical protein n=1 Tax=Hankyongella ginsenosidimutans TaxID=1763828 RepID=UPI00319E0105